VVGGGTLLMMGMSGASATGNRWDKMNLTVFANAIGEIDRHLAIDRHHEVMTELPTRHEMLPKARKHLIEIGEQLAQRLPLNAHLGRSVGKFLEHRWDEDERHGD